MVHPTTLACSRRPGSQLSHGASPLNMSEEMRLRNRISPIHKNSGSAVSVQLDVEPQTVSAMLSPTGREVNSSMPTTATAMSDSPIHSPEPSTANRATMSTRAIMASMAIP